MLKDRGLHITGNKQILIDRLIENDAPGAKQVAGNDLILICSKSGLELRDCLS